jgi:hypothetical protein
VVGRFKKKLDTELALFYPAQFGTDIQFIDKMREYELLMNRQVLGEKVDQLLINIADYFLQLQKPHVFNPFDENCVLIQNEKSFEDVCNSMEDNGIQNVKSLTVFEFYGKLVFLEKKAEKLKSKL